MAQFVDLLKESVIAQATITVVVVGTMCYLYLAGREVPESLIGMAMLILGFYFGSKTQRSLDKRAREVE